MKALTLYQPWAHLVAIGAKTIETRSWKTNYRGPLAIHAGVNTQFAFHGKHYICDTEPFYSVLQADSEKFHRTMSFGAIIATCELVGCEFIDDHQLCWQRGTRTWMLTAQELAFGDFTPGRYAWFLADIKKLMSPIIVKGAMGLWEWVDTNVW